MKDNRIGGFLCRKVLPTAVLVLAISVLLIRSLSVSMEQEKKTVRDNLEAQALVAGQSRLIKPFVQRRKPWRS